MIRYGLAVGVVVAEIALAVWPRQRVSTEEEEYIHGVLREEKQEKMND